MLVHRSLFRLSILLTMCLLNGLFLPILGNNREYYDIEFAYNLTKQLYVKHNLQTFVTFANERKLEKSAWPQLIIRSLERTLMEDLRMPLVICGLQNNATLYNIITSKTMTLAKINSFSPEMEPLLEVIDKTLSGRHEQRVLFMIKDLQKVQPTPDQLIQFFKWCWKCNFVNVALSYQWVTISNGNREVRNELFSYNPFPELRLLNVTEYGIDYDWQRIDLNNVQGYKFHVPVFQDIPTAFTVS